MFYGWLILAALAVIYFVTIGTTFYGFGVVLAPMTDSLGWSRAQAGFSIMALGMGLAGPLIASAIRLAGTRLTVFSGGFLTLGGVGLIYTTSALPAFYAGAAIMGLGLGMQTVIPGTQVLNNWFVRRRSLATGIFLTAGGVGAAVAAPGLNAAIEAAGSWRVAWLVMGGAAALASLIGAVVLRERPEDLGLHPDGDGAARADAPDPAGRDSARVFRTPVDWTAGEAARRPAFWLIVAAIAMSVLGLQIVNAHAVLHLRDTGIASGLAATAVGMQGLVSTGGRLFSGILGDRIDPRYLMAAGLASELIGLLVLGVADEPMLVYVFALFFGLGWGTAYVASPTLIANFFGRRHYAALFALQGVVATALGAVGPILAGLASDRTGSYLTAFVIYAMLAAAAAVAMAMLRAPRPREAA